MTKSHLNRGLIRTVERAAVCAAALVTWGTATTARAQAPADVLFDLAAGGTSHLIVNGTTAFRDGARLGNGNGVVLRPS